MRKVAGGLQARASESCVPSWLSEANPRARSVIAAASVPMRMMSTGTCEEAAGRIDGVRSVDGVRSAARDLQRWIDANPCPDPDLGDRFEVMAARYGYVGLVLESGLSRSDDSSLADAIDRLNTLSTEYTALLSDLEGQ